MIGSLKVRARAKPEDPTFGSDRLRLIARLDPWHFWFAGRHYLLKHLLTRYAPMPHRTLVDVGCGSGRIAREVAGMGFRVLAVDLHPEGPSAGRPRTWFVRADGCRLPVSDNASDVITALDVLEHTDDWLLTTELTRALKPGGILIVTVPALPWLWSARDEVAGHRRRYTRRSLTCVLESAALRILEVRFYQCLLLPLVVATRLAGRCSRAALAFEEQPGGRLNRLLTAINLLEVRLGDHIALPWGSTLVGVACKAG